jgi:hypothetical protein
VAPRGKALAVVLLVDGNVETVIGRVVALRPDLALVDTLARLQLIARRRGGSVLVRDASPDLRQLLHLVGLADVVCGSGLLAQSGGQPEGGEQLGIEKAADGGDPAV